ncbi:MAG TPA: hypothetical protein VEA17_12215 [Bordetella sp.]|nr:hypothetical protein [Bordetella sp.]
MKVLKRFLARSLNVVVKLLPRAQESGPPGIPASSSQPRRPNPMQSQWRVYRLYAIDSRLLLRGETGRVISIGTYGGADALLTYTLGAGANRGPWPSFPALLADASQQLIASKLERSLAQPAEHVAASTDLDRSPHLDVSLFLRQ